MDALVRLQDDLIETYNALTSFSKSNVPSEPLKVRLDRQGLGSPLVLEYKGTTVRLRIPVYYCLGLEDLEKPTYLLPKDYVKTMDTLQSLIMNPLIIEDRTCLSPENYGFDVYAVDPKQFNKGLGLIGRVRFISGNSWLFKLLVKWKYKLK